MNGYNAEAVAVAQGMAKHLRQARQQGNDLAALVRQLNAKIDAQIEEISKLRGKVAVQEMAIAGIDAARDAYMEQHADSPLLRDSGKRFKDGDVKTNARLIFEAAFDKKGRELGISNPAALRVD